jgi:hypothetical protein
MLVLVLSLSGKVDAPANPGPPHSSGILGSPFALLKDGGERMNGNLLRDEAGPPADGVLIQESSVGAKATSSRELFPAILPCRLMKKNPERLKTP